MPAKSKSQQRLFGMVHAYQKGKLKHAPASVKRIAKHISEEDAEHFAKTRHKGLPETKKAEIRPMTRYEQGFLTKCAEYGVPFETAVGMMQKMSEPQEIDIGRAVGDSLSSAVGFGSLAGATHAVIATPRLSKELLKTLKNFGKKVGKTALVGGGVAGLLRLMSELSRNSKKRK